MVKKNLNLIKKLNQKIDFNFKSSIVTQDTNLSSEEIKIDNKNETEENVPTLALIESRV
jgi:hypothetical protein